MEMVIGCDLKENNTTGRQWSTFTDRYSQYSVDWWIDDKALLWEKFILCSQLFCDYSLHLLVTFIWP